MNAWMRASELDQGGFPEEVSFKTKIIYGDLMDEDQKGGQGGEAQPRVR